MAVFGGVFGAEEAGVFAIEHVFAVGLEDAAVGAGDAEDLGEHFEVEAEGSAEAEAFGEGGGVDVHDHVDEGFDFGGFTGWADVGEDGAHFLEERGDGVEDLAAAADHELEGAFAGLGDGAGHTAFDAVSAGGFGGFFEIDVELRAEGGAVDEGATGGVGEERVAGGCEDGAHGGVVGDDGEDDIGEGGDLGEGVAGFGTDFGGEFGGGGLIDVVDGGDWVTDFVDAAGHIGTHASDSDEGDFLGHGVWGQLGDLNSG